MNKPLFPLPCGCWSYPQRTNLHAEADRWGGASTRIDEGRFRTSPNLGLLKTPLGGQQGLIAVLGLNSRRGTEPHRVYLEFAPSLGEPEATTVRIKAMGGGGIALGTYARASWPGVGILTVPTLTKSRSLPNIPSAPVEILHGRTITHPQGFVKWELSA